MHAAIVARAHEHAAIVRRHRLRFVRSSSAALPSSVEAELAQTFGVPVVEAYGMTEAAHQIASNDLSGERKLRSVGRAAGPEICIIGRDGERLPPGEVGEIAIRGPSVFPDYADNPEANAAAFTNGWFRTGDEGAVDEEGFLTLQGRTKEIINRGGEKVSPFEVDEALLRHAEVRQAVAFALPHDRLGEEVAAAVVLAPGSSADARELQDYVAEQLAPFKVPRRIVVVGELPTGATGKLQRIGLAERLGVEPVAQTAPPAAGTALEKELVAIWQAVLHRRDVAPGDDFFALGGDSILATEAVGHIRELIGDPDLRLVTIVRAPSPAAMALEIEAPSWVAGHGTIALSGEGDRDGKPLFLVHRGDGEILPFATLASRLGSIPTYGLRARGIDDGEEPAISIAEMASEYLGHVRRVQPRGPYRLGGFCLGGAIALEMAAQSLAGGEEVEGLILVDPRFRRPSGLALNLWLARRRLTERRFGRALVNRLAGKPRPGLDLDEDGREIERLLAQLREAHMPRAVELPATVILSADFERFQVPLWHLRRLVGAGSTWTRLPAAHSQLFRAPHVDAVAETVRAAVAT
jgi:thioesterase domain-containing protein